MSSYDTVTARMDDRHWWMVSKLQETFDGRLASTLLEEFICHPDTELSFSTFLSGVAKSVVVVESGGPNGRVRVAVGDRIGPKPTKIAYFRRCGNEATPVPEYDSIEKHVMWGELDSSVLCDLRDMVSTVALPLVERDASWGLCADSGRQSFHQVLDRFLTSLPPTALLASFRPLASPDPAHIDRIAEAKATGEATKDLAHTFEVLVEQWMVVIDDLLEEARAPYPEPDDGPAAVRSFWDRRFYKLKALEQQLRESHFQAPVAMLIASQSRVVRRWRSVDASITNAVNEAKDVIRFLELGAKLSEETYSGTPESISAALTAFSTNPKLFFNVARSNYAGNLLRELIPRLVKRSIVVSQRYLAPARDESSSWALNSTSDAISTQVQQCLKMSATFRNVFCPLCQKHERIFMDNPAFEGRIFPDDGPGLGEAVCQALLEPLEELDQFLRAVRGMVVAKKQYSELLRSGHGLGTTDQLERIEVALSQLDTLLNSEAIRRINTEHGDILSRDADSIESVLDKAAAEICHEVVMVPIEKSTKSSGPNPVGHPRSAMQELATLKIFSSVVKRTALVPIMSKAYSAVFRVYEAELASALETYERMKNDPPIPRGMPSVAGRVSWARQMLSRAQGPMDVFASMSDVMSESLHATTIKHFNKLATTLVKFETMWLSKWGTFTKTARRSLAATLLVEETIGGKKTLLLNFDPFFATMLDEAIALSKLGIQTSPHMQSLLVEQDKVKSFRDMASLLLAERERVLRMIPEHFTEILAFNVQAMEDAVAPGRASVTWEAPNVDGYFMAAMAKVKDLERCIVELVFPVKQQMDSTISGIADAEIAASAWTEGITIAEYAELDSRTRQTASAETSRLIETFTAALDGLVAAVKVEATKSGRDPGTRRKQLTRGRSSVIVSFVKQVHTALTQSAESTFSWLVEMLDQRKDTSTRRPPIVLDIEYALPVHTVVPSLEEVGKVFGGMGRGLLEYHSSCVTILHDLLEGVSPDVIVNFTDVTGESETRVENARSVFDATWASLVRAILSQLEETSKVRINATANFSEKLFSEDDRDLDTCSHVLQMLVQDEARADELPLSVRVGPVLLDAKVVKHALQSGIARQKNILAGRLRDVAKADLRRITDYVERTHNNLAAPVANLVQLSAVVGILDDLGEFSIDQNINAVEDMYETLIDVGMHVSRAETEAITNLREKCENLIEFAKSLKSSLTTERRAQFERLLDTEVKVFMVATIHLRNTFDLSGPKAADIHATEASHRLRNLEALFDKLQGERAILASIERLYGLPVSEYAELDATGRDLRSLAKLYDLHERFVKFNSELRKFLWAEVDLNDCAYHVDEMLHILKDLPTVLQKWPAFVEMSEVLSILEATLPLLKLLANKAIRDRHWREVMNICGITFELDGLQFSVLLELNLLKHKNKIQELSRRAIGEAEVEQMLRQIELDWTEQIFLFDKFEPIDTASSLKIELPQVIILDEDGSQRQIDKATDAHGAMVAVMGSTFVAPHNSDLISWKAKLYEVSDFLSRWRMVQALWKCLRVIFSGNISTLSATEIAAFATAQRDYFKFTASACECQNILQFCYGQDSETSKLALLDALGERFEACRKALSAFLEIKRQNFPRFYFASDGLLLDTLGLGLAAWRSSNRFRPDFLVFVFNEAPWLHKNELGEIFALESSKGERLTLDKPVPIVSDSSTWLKELVDGTSATLRKQIALAVTEATDLGPVTTIPTVEQRAIAVLFTEKVVTATQASTAFLRLLWTAQIEHAITIFRTSRYAYRDVRDMMEALLSRFAGLLQRECQGYSPAAFRGESSRLQSLVNLCVHLRDCADQVSQVRPKDETDYAWLRRCRMAPTPGAQGDVEVRVVDATIGYGYEYWGSREQITITPMVEKNFVQFALAMRDVSRWHGSILKARPSECGRTATVEAYANTCGKYFLTYACEPTHSPTALGRIIQGLSRVGGWGCFVDVEKLGVGLLAKMASSVQMMYAEKLKGEPSVHRGSAHTQKSDNHLHSLNGVPHVFLLPSRLSNDSERSALSQVLRSAYRPIEFNQPALLPILQARCTAAGIFPVPIKSAEKLTYLAESCIKQYGNEKWCSFSLSRLLRVIDLAAAFLKAKTPVKKSSRSNQNVLSATTLATAVSSMLDLPTSAKKRRGLAPTKGISPTTSTARTRTTNSTLPPIRSTIDLKATASMYEGAGHALDELAIVAAFAVYFRAQLPNSGRINLDDFLASSYGPEVADQIPNVERDVRSVFSRVSREEDILAQLKVHAEERSLICTEAWSNKCLEILTASTLSDVTVLVGDPGTGKSSCFDTLMLALSAVDAPGTTHRVHRMCVGAMSEEQLLGKADNHGQWVDGYLTAIIRKLYDAAGSSDGRLEINIWTWLVLDCGTLDFPNTLTKAFRTSSCMTLGNGDRIPIREGVRIIFETTPAEYNNLNMHGVLSNGYPVFFDQSVVTTQVLTDSWLKTRRLEEAQLLSELFNRSNGKWLEDAIAFFRDEVESFLQVPLCGLMDTMFALMTSLLAPSVQNGEVLTKTSLECVLVFSLVWSHGGLVKPEHYSIVHTYLKDKCTTSLVPQDQPTDTVYDYCLTPKADWITWKNDVKTLEVDGIPASSTSGFVHTATSRRLHFLMERVSARGKNVLVIGPAGSGRGASIDHFVDEQGRQIDIKRYVCSRGSTPADLRRFMDCNTVQRNGNVYGAEEGRAMSATLRDIDLLCHPGDRHGTGEVPYEVLRVLLEGGNWFKADDQMAAGMGSWCWIGDATLFATAEFHGEESRHVGRLLRHFSVFALPSLEESTLTQILTGKTIAHLRSVDGGEHLPQVGDVAKELCKATSTIFTSLNSRFPVSGNRWCYNYLADDCIQIVDAVTRIPPRMLHGSSLVAFWAHECRRVLADRCHDADDVEIAKEIRSRIIEKVKLFSSSGAKSAKAKGEIFLIKDLDDSLRRQRMTFSDLICDDTGTVALDGIPESVFMNKLAEHELCKTSSAREELMLLLRKYGVAPTEPETEMAVTLRMLRQLRSAHCLDFLEKATTEDRDGRASYSGLPAYVIDVFSEAYLADPDPASAGFESPPNLVYSVSDGTDRAEAELDKFNAIGSAKGLSQPLSLSPTRTEHLLRAARVIATDGCCGVFAGGRAQLLEDILRFAAFVGKQETVVLSSDVQQFKVDLRHCFRIAGSKNLPVTAIIHGEDLSDEVLDRLNGFVTCGEIFDLFAADELKTLYKGLEGTMKEQGVTSTASKFFTGRVRRNVHILLIFAECGERLQQLTIRFPALLRKVYFNRCEGDRLVAEEAVTFFRGSSLLREASLNVRNLASAVLKRFHEVAVTMTSTVHQSFKFQNLLCCFLKLFEKTLQHRKKVNEAMERAIATCNEVVESIDNMKTLLVENTEHLEYADQALTSKLDEVLIAAAAVAEAEHEEVEVKDDEELLSAFVEEQGARIAGDDSHTRLGINGFHALGYRSDSPDHASAMSEVERTREELEMWQSKITARRTDALRALKNPNKLVRLVIDMISIVLSKRLDPTVSQKNVQKGNLVDSWAATQDVISQPNFHILIQTYTPDHFTGEMLELLEPYFGLPHLTAASVRESAKDVAVYFEWICQLAAHYRAQEQVKEVIRKSIQVGENTSEIEGQNGEKEVAVLNAQSPKKAELIAILEKLQTEFDEFVQVKQGLERTREMLISRLESATKLRDSLGEDIEGWNDLRAFQGESTVHNSTLLFNSLAAAAFVTYSGTMSANHRIEFKKSVSLALGLILKGRHDVFFSNASVEEYFQELWKGRSDVEGLQNVLFADVSLSAFLQHMVPAMPMKMPSVDSTNLVLNHENLTLLEMSQYANTWPLAIDPTQCVEDWFRCRDACVLHYTEDRGSLMLELARCLVEGKHVLIAHVEIERLWNDTQLRHLLRRDVQYNSRHVPSIWLDGRQVELNASFRLYLSTSIRSFDVPDDFAATVTVVDVTPTVNDLKHSVMLSSACAMDTVVAYTVLKHINSQRKVATKVAERSDRLVEALASSFSRSGGQQEDLFSHTWVESITNLKSSLTEAQAELDVAAAAESTSQMRMYDEAPYTNAVAGILRLLLVVPQLHVRYGFFEESIKCFRETMAAHVADEGALAVHGILPAFVREIYARVTPRLLEADRRSFLFILALILGVAEDEELRASAHEIEVKEEDEKLKKDGRHTATLPRVDMLDPDKKTTTLERAIGSSRVADDVFSMIIHPVPHYVSDALDAFFRPAVLDAHHRKEILFNTVFREKAQDASGVDIRQPWLDVLHYHIIPKDTDTLVRHRQDWGAWRDLRATAPQLLPGNYGDNVRPLLRYLLASALNPIGEPRAAALLTDQTLGAMIDRIAVPLGLETVLPEDCRQPTVLLQGVDSGDTITTVQLLARSRRRVLRVVRAGHPDSQPLILDAFKAATTEGYWLMVCDVDLDPEGFDMLLAKLQSPQTRMHEEFRLFVSQGAAKTLWPTSVSLTEYSCCAKSLTLKSNFLRCLSSIPVDVCNVSQRAEYSALLHNVTYLHCVLISRLRFGTVGFSCNYAWCEAERQEVLEFVYNEYSTQAEPRIGTVRSFMIAVYGRTTMLSRDRNILSALCETWISPSALKPGYEFKFPVTGPATPTLHVVPMTLQRKAETKWVHHTPRNVEIMETVKLLAQAPHLHEESLAELCGLNVGTRCDHTIDRIVHRKVKRMVRELAPTNILGGDLHATGDHVVPAPELSVEEFGEEIKSIRKRIPKHVETRGNRKATVVFNGLQPRRTSAVGRGVGAVARFVKTEIDIMNNLLSYVRQDLLTMAAVYGGTAAMSPTTLASIEAILRHRLPRAWEEVSWQPRPGHSSLNTWIEDLQIRVRELEKLHKLGTRITSVFLGGFFNPRGFLGALQQEAALPSHPSPTLRVEVTTREKDHLREPPVDGVFVYNVSLEGGTWFSGALRDTLTPSKRQMLPVLHLTYSQHHEQPVRQRGDALSGPAKTNKAAFDSRPEQPTVHCPVYITPRRCADDDQAHIFSLEMPRESTASGAKFVARGVAASLRT